MDFISIHALKYQEGLKDEHLQFRTNLSKDLKPNVILSRLQRMHTNYKLSENNWRISETLIGERGRKRRLNRSSYE